MENRLLVAWGMVVMKDRKWSACGYKKVGQDSDGAIMCYVSWLVEVTGNNTGNNTVYSEMPTHKWVYVKLVRSE